MRSSIRQAFRGMSDHPRSTSRDRMTARSASLFGWGSISAALSATASCLFALAILTAPLPKRDRERIRFNSIDLRQPGAVSDRLMNSFDSPLAFSQFLGRYGTRSQCTNPLDYTRTFRRTFDEFERSGFTGDCNDFANAMAQVGWAHGYPMGIVSMWPRRWQDRLSKDWHQIAVLCLEEDQDYLIFEFEKVFRWRKPIEEYARLLDKTILPVGGVLEWQPTRPNILARFLDHLRSNQPLPQNHRSLVHSTDPVT